MQRLGRFLLLPALLLAMPGCDDGESVEEHHSEPPAAVGKADGIPAGDRVRWDSLQVSGCTLGGVVNDPRGNGYASSWLFQGSASVSRCTLRGSATFPAGVRVRTMRVQGDGWISPPSGFAGEVALSVRGTRGQSILQGAASRSFREEGSVVFEGFESVGSACLTGTQTFGFSADFAVGTAEDAQFDSLDVVFDVEEC